MGCLLQAAVPLSRKRLENARRLTLIPTSHLLASFHPTNSTRYPTEIGRATDRDPRSRVERSSPSHKTFRSFLHSAFQSMFEYTPSNRPAVLSRLPKLLETICDTDIAIHCEPGSNAR